MINRSKQNEKVLFGAGASFKPKKLDFTKSITFMERKDKEMFTLQAGCGLVEYFWSENVKLQKQLSGLQGCMDKKFHAQEQSFRDRMNALENKLPKLKTTKTKK